MCNGCVQPGQEGAGYEDVITRITEARAAAYVRPIPLRGTMAQPPPCDQTCTVFVCKRTCVLDLNLLFSLYRYAANHHLCFKGGKQHVAWLPAYGAKGERDPLHPRAYDSPSHTEGLQKSCAGCVTHGNGCAAVLLCRLCYPWQRMCCCAAVLLCCCAAVLLCCRAAVPTVIPMATDVLLCCCAAVL